MIITRTPLRIPLGGGGTDLPSFYEKYGSFFISASLDYYIYVAVKHRPLKGIRLGHSQIEEVSNISQITHPIIKASLKYLKIPTKRGLEIASIGDLPSSTGLGSSGSFTVGLVHALLVMNKKKITKEALAKFACDININKLKNPSGKQDEYIASYGGITCFRIDKKGSIQSYPLAISSKTIQKLESNLMMFYTGITRTSRIPLTNQKRDINKGNKKTINNLMEIQKIGYEIKNALEAGNTKLFGTLLDKHWMLKRQRKNTSNEKIDRCYNIAKANGAIGGKIMGAGGGGFFLFYCENNKTKIRKALEKEGLEELKFHFDFEGTKLILNS